MTVETDTIYVEIRNGVGWVTLNRPDRLNALTGEMTQHLADTILDLGDDDAARCVVLTGAGRAFCAGADMGGMASRAQGDQPQRSAEETRRGFKHTQRLILGIHNIEKPVIAMVNGDAVGAGFDIACACDLRTASTTARFMVAFTRIGLVPGWGGTWLMPRLMGIPKALELLFTGDFLSAEDALRCNFVNAVYEPDALLSETTRLAERIAAGPPISMRLNKLQVYKGLEMTLDSAVKFNAVAETITLASADHREGVTAFREKRPAQYTGR
jgi:2-(1,2-epoxy-1,2-dihydrophenyl)acetyl-CoA isomerase